MEESSVICPSEEELADVKDIYNCTEENCSSVFKNISNLRMHLTKHHKKGFLSNGIFSKDAKYVCPVNICVYNINSDKKKWFSQRRLLKQHYMKVHAEKRHICTKCNSKFSILSTFQRHIKICGAKFVCGVCQWQYNSNESLMVHLLRKHPEEHKKYIKNKKSDKIEEYITNPVNVNIYNVNHPSLFNQITFELPNEEMQNADDPSEIDQSKIIILENSNTTHPCIKVNSNNKHENIGLTNQVKEKIRNISNKASNNKLFNENRDCFTQTSVKTVKKSSHSKIKKLNAETQTSLFKDKLLKQVKRIDKSTNISRYSKRCYRTFGTQTINEVSVQNTEAICSKDSVNDGDIKSVFQMNTKNNILCNVPDSNLLIEKQFDPTFKFSDNSTYNNAALMNCASSTEFSSNNLDSMFVSKSYNVVPENQVHIETQTALDELLYSNLTKENELEEHSSLFSEHIYISDIQTQTAWPTNNETIDKSCNSLYKDPSCTFSNEFYNLSNCNDFISTETQTCQFPDFDNEDSSFNISSPYFKDSDCEYFAGENIGDDFLDRNKVLKSDIFFSCETQTCFQDLLEDNCNGNKESNKNT